MSLIKSLNVDLFEYIVSTINVSPVLVATTLENTLKSLKRDGVPVENIGEEKIIEMFKLIADGKIIKEAIPQVLSWMAKNPDKDVNLAITALGLSQMTDEEIISLIDKTIKENIDYIKERGERAMGKLMGELMRIIRGRADGKRVSILLKERLAKYLTSQ